MWTCPKCGESVEDEFEVCWNCGTGKDGTEDPSFQRAEDVDASELPASAGRDATPARPPRATPVAPTAGEEPAGGAEPRRKPRRERVIVTTTPAVEGKRIRRYCGLVTGEAILGANAFKDFFASITDVIGGRSAAYEGELRRAREIALRELEQAARDLGANAVVGVDLDYEALGQSNTMLMVSVSGTAVVVE
jgi:uncharacterized protein YbjQ (UPF0145 family)